MKPFEETDYNTGPLNLLMMEKRFIIEALKRAKCRQGKTSELLGLVPRTLYRKIIQHKIDVDNIRKLSN